LFKSDGYKIDYNWQNLMPKMGAYKLKNWGVKNHQKSTQNWPIINLLTNGLKLSFFGGVNSEKNR
jgi:hypothetical protein